MRLGLEECRFEFYSNWFTKWTKSVQTLQIQMQPKVTGKSILRNHRTDFNKWYTVRRAVVWMGAVLDFIEIGSH